MPRRNPAWDEDEDDGSRWETLRDTPGVDGGEATVAGTNEAKLAPGETPSHEVERPSQVPTLAAASVEPAVEGRERIGPGSIVFERYRVGSLLGRGGMGEVWMVRDVDLDVDRALKVIAPTGAIDAETFGRFRREARLMARLTHAHAVTVHDFRLDGRGAAYIVMEYISGTSLEKVLRRGEPMPVSRAGRLLEQLCGVLQVAHDNGIVHRDLKPSNLMLLEGRPEGQEHLKVLDFGIAKSVSGEAVANDAKTTVGAFLGTPPYTSPEQAEGASDARSDIYSVGVILYEFLTGFRPFQGSVARVIAETMNVAPPAFAAINPDARVPAAVEAVVMRCLAKKPEARFDSARALAEAYLAAAGEASTRAGATATSAATGATTRKTGSWATGRRTRVGPATEVGGVAPPRSRLPLVLGGGAAAVVGLAVLAVALTRPRRGDDSGRSRAGGSEPTIAAPTPPTPPTSTPDHLVVDGRSYYLRAGRHYLPDGYAPADSDTIAEDGWPAILVRQADAVRFVRIPGGTFAMGGIDAGEDAEPANTPQHSVTLTGYYLQQHEVTQQEVEAFARSLGETSPLAALLGPWRSKYDELATQVRPEAARKHPAGAVPWRVAEAFARARQGYLPTEAQWEFAARSRGGPSPLVWSREDERKLGAGRLSNLGTTRSAPFTDEVGSYKTTDRTAQGVLDLAGNLREWCRDESRPYTAAPATDPDFAPAGSAPDPALVMAIRGGSYNSDLAFKYVTARHPGLPLGDDAVPFDVGFRVALRCPEVHPPPATTPPTSRAPQP